MTKKVVVFIVALTLIMSLFTGCKDSLIERLEKVQAHITITAKLPDELKTGDFDPDDFSYILKWYLTADPSKVDQDEFPYDENLAIVYKFDPGEYTFELSAIVGGVLKAHGKNTIAIDRGQRDKLEIPLTYYIYGEDKGGFTVGEGVITLSGKLELAGNETISIPSGMRLVIEEGCTIDVGAGKTLTFDGVVETLGDLVVKGNLALTKDAELHAQGGLSVDGTFNTVQGAAVVVDDKLAVTGTMDIGGHVKVGSLPDPSAEVTEFAADVKAGGVLEVSALHPQYTGVTVDGGGTLRVVEDTTLDTIVLKASSTLEGVGVLKSGTLSGEGNVKGGSIDVDTIATVAGKSLALEGPVAVTHVTGDGTLKVDGTVTADELTIEGTATLEATGLAAKGDTVTIDGGGSLLVKGDTDLRGKAIVLADDSKLEIDGELTSGSLSGKGSIAAEMIHADEVVLKATELLTLNGELTTGKISGNGSLDAQSIIGSDDKLIIEDNPVVTGNLSLQPDTTISFTDGNASLMVNGNVNAWGNLTLEGEGNLAAKGNITVQKKLNRGDSTVGAGGDVEEGKIPLGDKPHLEVYIPMGEDLELYDIEPGWETVTVLGGGTFIVNTVTADTIYEINLEKGSALKITNDLPLADRIDKDGVAVGAIINFSRDSTLTVSGDVKAAGDLAVSGDGDFDITEKVDVAGDFTIDGTAVIVDSLSMATDSSLEITDDGSLTITGTESTNLVNIVLEDGATMDVAGALTSTNISGEGAITADSISVDTIKTEAGKVLTLVGDVTLTKEVTGDGRVEVDGTLTAETLSIDKDAILEASGLKFEIVDGKKTLTIQGGGTLKINGNIDLSGVDIVLEDGSKLEIDGTLTSNTISGSGTVKADNIVVGTIKTEVGKPLTLDGDVTPDSIEGKGSLAVTGVVSGAITIFDTPTVIGDLSLGSNTTVSIVEKAKLIVEGDVDAAGNLTLSGEGTLDAKQDLTVEKDLTINGATLDVTETMKSGIITGNGKVTASNIKVDTITTIEEQTLSLKGSVTTCAITGKGKLVVDGVVGGTEGNLAISGSPEITGNLKLAKDTTLIFGAADTTLKVTGNVVADGNLIVTGNGEFNVTEGLTVKNDFTINAAKVSADSLSMNGEKATLAIAKAGSLTIKNKLTPKSTKIHEVVLSDGATMNVGGSLESNKISGSGDIEAPSITVDTIDTTAGETLKLDTTTEDTSYSITITEVTGSGTVEVVNSVSVNTLSINNGATLKACGVIVDSGTLTITGGGTLIDTCSTELDLTKVELADGSKLEVVGTLKSTTISGDGTIKAGSIVASTIDTVEDKALTLTGVVDDTSVTVTSVTGKGTANVIGTVTAKELLIADGTTLTATNLAVSGDAFMITGGGSLVVENIQGGLTSITLGDDSALDVTGDPTKPGDAKLSLSADAMLTLGSGATLTVDGPVESTGTITLSGNGALDAGSVEADTLSTVGNQTITADTFDVNELAPGAGTTLTLNGNVATEIVTGNVKVDGTVTAGELSIAGGATLEASGLTVDGNTLTITDGGLLKVTDDTNLSDKDTVLADGSTLEINGTLESKTISGDGTVQANSIKADTIKTVEDQTLTLDSNVTAGTISGNGNLDAQKIVGADYKLFIEGAPTVTGDLTLEADTTLSFVGDGSDNASLTVKGDVKAWGNLTLEGQGTLDVDAKNKIYVEKVYEKGADVTVSKDETEIIIGTPIGSPSDGNKNLVLHIESGETLPVDTIEDGWKTITVIGDGILNIKEIETTLDAITLGDDAVLNVTGKVSDPNGDAKLNLGPGATLTLGSGSTLTVDGPVNAEGDLTLSGEGTLEAESLSLIAEKTLEIKNAGSLVINGSGNTNVDNVVLSDGAEMTATGPLKSTTLSGSGSITASTIQASTIDTVAGGTLKLDTTSDDPNDPVVPITVTTVTGSGTVVVAGTVTAGTPLSIASGATLEASTLDDTVDSLTINGGGTLKITDDTIATTLGNVELNNGSELEITGTLKGVGEVGKIEIKVSGNGALAAGKIDADKLSPVGDQTITADTFDVKELAPEAGKSLTLIGDVTTKAVSGNVKVDGTLTAGNLSIAPGATLEALGLEVEIIDGKKTLTIKGGGTLKVSGDIDLSGVNIVLEDGSILEIDGTLTSGSISGAGTVKADSITTGTLSNAGDLAITADAIVADEIKLNDKLNDDEGKKLTINGDLTTGKISGDGNLDAKGEVAGTGGTVTISGTPTVTGDLELVAGSTVTIDENATLTVTGDITAAGNLTVLGDGTLEAKQDLSVAGDFTAQTVVKVGSLDIGDNKTVEISSGGSLTINDTGTTTLDNVVLSDGATLTVAGNLESDTISGEGTLKAGSIDVGTIETVKDKSLTLSGAVSVDAVTGNGTATVVGTVTVETLTIEDTATLVASTLETSVGTDTVTIGGGGSLQVNSDIDVDNIVLTNGSTLEVDGTLTSKTISGEGTIKAESVGVGTIETEKGKALTVTGIADEVTGETKDVSVAVANVTGDGTATIIGTVTAGDLSIAPGASLDASTLDADGTTLKITDGGTLKVTGDTTLETVVLEGDSALVVAGTLNGKDETGFKVSGTGSLTAGKIDADKLSTVGNQTITADTFDVNELAPEAGTTLTLNGDVTTETISGNVKVEGAVTAGDLSIADGATLEATDLTVVGDTLTIKDGGTLKVKGDTTLDTVTLEGDSTLEIDGTLTSGTISGDGTVKANSIKVDTIETVKDQTLTLDSTVTAGTISGDGNLDTQKIVGSDDKLEIKGTPTVTGDLALEAGTILSIGSDATLTVEKDVIGWGDLTLEGTGSLDVTGSITTVGDNNAETSGVTVKADSIKSGSIPLDEDNKPHLVMYIKSEDTVNLGTIPEGWETVTVKGGGTLKVDGIVAALDAITLEDGSRLEILGNPLLAGDAKLNLRAGAALTLSAGAELTIDGSIAAAGALTLSGPGVLEAARDLTVAGNFTTESDVNVKNTLDVKGDAKIAGDVTVGSLVIANGKSVEISGDGSLTIANTGTTKITEVKLSDSAALDVAGPLESTQLSGSGTITASTIKATTIDTTAGGTLTLDSTIDAPITITTVTGSGTVEVVDTAKIKTVSIASGATLTTPKLAVDGNTLTINSGGTLIDTSDSDLNLTKVALAGGSALELGGSLTSTTIAGTGTVKVDGKLTVPGSSIAIAKEATLEAGSLVGTGPLTITGGGTLKIAADTTLGEIVLKDGSVLEFAGSLEGSESTTIDISGPGTVVVKGTVTATDLIVGPGAALDVSKGTFDINDGTKLHVDGTLQLGSNGWEPKDLGIDESITISGSGDIKRGGTYINWYTLYGAYAQYFREGDGDVQIRFLEGTGNKKVTPRTTGITPTETIVRVGAGATFETPAAKNNFYLEAGDTIIVEDGGIFDLVTYWFGNLDRTKHQGTITILSTGSLKWAGKVTVADKDQTGWHAWAWKQDGTITEISHYYDPGKTTCNFKFTALATDAGENEINIAHPAVVTRIEVGEGVTATISNKIIQQSSEFTIKGTVDVDSSGEFTFESGSTLIFGAKDAKLNVRTGGTFKHYSDDWISFGVKDQGTAKIEGGAKVTLGVYWFGPVGDSGSRFTAGTNVLVTITDNLLAVTRKVSTVTTNNTLSAQRVGNAFGTPGVNMSIGNGTQFNIAANGYFANRGNLDIQSGATFSVGSSAHYAINTGKTLTLHSGAHLSMNATGKIESILSKYYGGVIDIEKDATVDINKKTNAGAKATYSGNVTNHKVKYKGGQVLP